MEKTTILFGAGAEADVLSCGRDFAYAVIGHNTDNMNQAIQQFYTSLKTNGWYSSYTKDSIDKEKLLAASVYRKYLEGKLSASKHDDIKATIDS